MLPVRRVRYLSYVSIVVLLSACGGVEHPVTNAPPVASEVTITGDTDGTAVVGTRLEGSFTYFDAEGDEQGVAGYRWLRNGIIIGGATANTYILVLDDSGQSISLAVTPGANTGTTPGAAATSARSIEVLNHGPIASEVHITSANQNNYAEGELLTGHFTYEDPDGDPEGNAIFQWLLDDVEIEGAIEKTYSPKAGDIGKSITFQVTPVAESGVLVGEPVKSEDQAPIAKGINARDENFGEAEVGDVLTGIYTFFDAENSPEGESTYRWLRNGSPIADATGLSYTLVVEDSGRSISFEVTPKATIGTLEGAPVASDGTTVINNAPSAVEGTVKITDGTEGPNNGVDIAVVGTELTGEYDYVDAEGDLEGTSTFRWLRNGIAISGATAQTYTLVDADVPAQIVFEVTAVARTGSNRGVAQVSANLATGTAPAVAGFARYLDLDLDNGLDGGDQLIVPFDQFITNNSAESSDLTLAVDGDRFGIGASVTAGPARNEVTITLGTTPVLKSRQDFSGATTTAGSASGVDVSALMTLGAIESISGIDAQPSTPIDVIPAFVDSGQSLAANDSLAVALGNVDNDGDQDMVVANAGGQGNRVYLNGGDGNFNDSGQSLGSSISYAVALGDVDGDGYLDMVVANWGQGNRIYLNDGDGSGNFTDSGQSLGLNNSASVALGDVEPDGDLDIVVANWNQGNRVYLNDGSGTFSDAGQSLGAGHSYSLALANVDGSNGIDLVVANYSGQGNRVYLNDGTGVFTDSGQSLGANNSLSVAVGDVDGDTHLDIAVANYTGQGNRIYLNNGSGVFTDSGQGLGDSFSASTALADVDGDGDLDMVVANKNDQENRVYINDGNGGFADSGQTLGTGNSFSVALGNLDAGADLDMVVANRGQGNRVYFGSLTGTD